MNTKEWHNKNILEMRGANAKITQICILENKDYWQRHIKYERPKYKKSYQTSDTNGHDQFLGKQDFFLLE